MQSIFVKKSSDAVVSRVAFLPGKVDISEHFRTEKVDISDANPLGELTLEHAFSLKKLTLDTLPEGPPRLLLIARHLYFSQLRSWPPSQQLG